MYNQEKQESLALNIDENQNVVKDDHEYSVEIKY